MSTVTPLGLSDYIAASSVKAGQFRYAPDLSPIGQGTIPRTDYRVNRLSDTSSEYPQNITDIFSSATDRAGTTVAGLFDIEWRSFVQIPSWQKKGVVSTKAVDQSKTRTVGRFHMYESLIMHEGWEIVAGLIVDMKNGGIGFRNHTIPSDLGDGAEWEEDLLWIEPETACVNTNLTVDFPISDIDRDDPFLLIDRGGFFTLGKNDPGLDQRPQAPELWMRAYRGATLSNTNLMGYYNESHETTRIGKSYNLGTMTQVQANQIGLINFIDAGPQLPGVPLDPTIEVKVNGSTEWLKSGEWNLL